MPIICCVTYSLASILFIIIFSVSLACAFYWNSDEAQSLWVWRYEGNDAYYDIGEDIKVRVMNIEYAPNVRRFLLYIFMCAIFISPSFASSALCWVNMLDTQRHVVTKPSDVLDGSAPKALSDFIPPMRVYVRFYFASIRSSHVAAAPLSSN